MGRYTDNAPIGNTCPMINDVISIIENVNWNLEDEEEAELNKSFIEAKGIMERIREANTSLREWGNELYQEKEELEKERDDLLEKVSQLEGTIKHLENLVEER